MKEPKSRKKLLTSYKKATRIFIQKCFNQGRISGPVLEIGSGKNRFNRNLFSKKYKVIATNIYPKNVVDYICSINCLPFEDNKFGCVICEHVLEHVEEPQRALDEIKRVLKPDGLLILIVPFSWPIHEKPYDLWRFTEEGLRHLLMKRFRKINFETFGRPEKPKLIFTTARKPIFKEQRIIHPKVSVIMPTYNRAHMISKSIDSVLKQTCKDWELIIVSDGSTDNTKEVIAKYKDPRITFLEKKKNTGPAAARNCGFKYAKGDYIAYCDDDTIIFPYHLETLANYLDRHPEVGFVRGHGLEFPLNKNFGHRKRGLLWALMHKRSILKKAMGFNEKLKLAEDIDFILRLGDNCPSRVLEYIGTKYSVHRQSTFFIHQKQNPWFVDQVYSKRVRKIFGRQKMDKVDFILVLRKPYIKTVLNFSKIFHSQYSCIESAFLLGLSFYRAKNTAKAIEFMRKVIDYKTEQCNKESGYTRRIKEYAYAFVGMLYLDKRKYILSTRYLCRGLKLNPSSLLLKVELFHAYLENERIDLAQEILKKTRNRPAISYMKGALALHQKDYHKAKEYFYKVERLDKSLRYRLFFSIGKLCTKINRKNMAEKLYAMSLSSKVGTYRSVLLSQQLLKVEQEYKKELRDKIFFPRLPDAIRII